MVDTGLSARDIAQWFVVWAEEAENTDLTPLKVQKLLYYAKGVFMSNSGGVPLFLEHMQAWSQGPVVPEVYHDLKRFGRNPIDPDQFVSDDFDWDKFAQVEDSLVETWQRYAVYSAWALRNKTHQESPWINNFTDGDHNFEITDADLKEFFCKR